MTNTSIEYTALLEIRDYLQQLTYRFSIGDPSFFDESSNPYFVISRRLVEISTEIERSRNEAVQLRAELEQQKTNVYKIVCAIQRDTLSEKVVSLEKALASCDPTGYDGHAETCVVCGERLYYYNPHTELEERKPHKPDCLWIKAHEVFDVAD